MKQQIIEQSIFILQTFLNGFLIMAVYDVLRLVRYMLKPAYIIVAVADVLYFTLSACLIFYTFYQFNNGIVRGYLILILSGGGFVYHLVFSGVCMAYGQRFIRFFIWKPYRKIRDIARKVYKKIKEILCKFHLKNRVKE